MGASVSVAEEISEQHSVFIPNKTKGIWVRQRFLCIFHLKYSCLLLPVSPFQHRAVRSDFKALVLAIP